MLVRGTSRPGLAIGINGARREISAWRSPAVTTGLLVKYAAGARRSWCRRCSVASLAASVSSRLAPRELRAAGARRADASPRTTRPPLGRIFAVMTMAAIASSLLFNLTTNGNGQLLRERLAGIVEDPALLGALLACVYVVASFAQVAIGLLIDRVSDEAALPRRRGAPGAAFHRRRRRAAAGRCFALQVAFMIAVFGAIPFTDAMIVRFVDDRIRSRVSGHAPLRLLRRELGGGVGCSGRSVKAAGFGAAPVVDGRRSPRSRCCAIAAAAVDRRRRGQRAGRQPPPQSHRAAD